MGIGTSNFEHTHYTNMYQGIKLKLQKEINLFKYKNESNYIVKYYLSKDSKFKMVELKNICNPNYINPNFLGILQKDSEITIYKIYISRCIGIGAYNYFTIIGLINGILVNITSLINNEKLFKHDKDISEYLSDDLITSVQMIDILNNNDYYHIII